jgi:hypothetical protein
MPADYGGKPGIFFKLARCGYTLRVTSQASYSPEYITPTKKKIIINISVSIPPLSGLCQAFCNILIWTTAYMQYIYIELNFSVRIRCMKIALLQCSPKSEGLTYCDKF